MGGPDPPDSPDPGLISLKSGWLQPWHPPETAPLCRAHGRAPLGRGQTKGHDLSPEGEHTYLMPIPVLVAEPWSPCHLQEKWEGLPGREAATALGSPDPPPRPSGSVPAPLSLSAAWQPEGPSTGTASGPCSGWGDPLPSPRQTLPPTRAPSPPHSREQCTPASSLCPQSPSPHGSAGQFHRDASLPRHPTSSSHTGPEPGPKAAPARAPTAGPQPSWRHTTSASARSQESSHTVPQEPACQSSTRPEQLSLPPRTRSVPSPGRGGCGHCRAGPR